MSGFFELVVDILSGYFELVVNIVGIFLSKIMPLFIFIMSNSMYTNHESDIFSYHDNDTANHC